MKINFLMTFKPKNAKLLIAIAPKAYSDIGREKVKSRLKR